MSIKALTCRLQTLALLFDCRCRIIYHKHHDLPRLKPTEERFNSSMSKIIVRPDFMSELVQLLQKDSKNRSCRVGGTMEELPPSAPFACAIFEAKCNYLTFLDSENGLASKVPVLSKFDSSVLSSLKVGLGFVFCLPSSQLHQRSCCLKVLGHAFLI